MELGRGRMGGGGGGCLIRGVPQSNRKGEREKGWGVGEGDRVLINPEATHKAAFRKVH